MSILIPQEPRGTPNRWKTIAIILAVLVATQLLFTGVLLTEIISLRRDYSKQYLKLKNLQNQKEALLNKYITLNQTLNKWLESYEKLRKKVNLHSGTNDVKPLITPEDPGVSQLVLSLTGGWQRPGNTRELLDDAFILYNWVVENIEYRSDSPYPVLPPTPDGPLEFREDVWQFANETLQLSAGDCEDMAILLCSLILNYVDGVYPVECIIIEGSSEAHVAVQLYLGNGKIVILDPAGRYYTCDAFWQITAKDVETEVHDWLNYWAPILGSGVHVSAVFSDEIYVEFASTENYISWMLGRGVSS